MCAASCMALILPALGVVKFPVLDKSALQSLATQTQNAIPPANPTQINADPQTSAGMLVAAQVSGQDNTSIANGPNDQTTQQPNSSPTLSLGKIPFTQVASQKVGLGVWLLLLPTMLLGLTMWTFGSSPKTSK